MPVKDWFFAWFTRHTGRHPIEWPNNSEFADAWLAAFVKRGITEEIANEASVELVAVSPRFANEHLPALLAAADRIFKDRNLAAAGLQAGSLDEAKALSRDCPDCGGSGTTIRYRRLSAGNIDARGHKVDPYVTFFCTCPMGRWTLNANVNCAKNGERRDRPNVAKTNAAIAALENHDLARHPFLQLGRVHWTTEPDNRYRYSPDLWDDLHNRPRSTHLTFASIRAAIALLGRVPTPAPRQPDPPPSRASPRPVPVALAEDDDDDLPF